MPKRRKKLETLFYFWPGSDQNSPISFALTELNCPTDTYFLLSGIEEKKSVGPHPENSPCVKCPASTHFIVHS